MMRLFRKELVRAYDVISVLMFSILANFLFSLRIDFREPIDLVAVVRLVSLAGGCVLFYGVASRVATTWQYSLAEYGAESSVKKRALRSSEDRYNAYIERIRTRLVVALSVSVMFFTLFFFVGALLP